MSGGVDSSVAALLLKRQGYDVTGVYMKNWSDPLADDCLWRDDIRDFKKVCSALKIPALIENFEEEYRRKVVTYLINGYRHGLTPNPDMLCNREIKFKLFSIKAKKMGADMIATGHYVIKKTDHTGLHHLYSAADSAKDQSYFLSLLTQKQLSYSLFPIGMYLKKNIRLLAKKSNLPVYNKPDSQGICFVGKVKFKDFMKKFIPSKPGPIMTTAGKFLGKHDGLAYYTIGQRHGLHIGGGIPFFITKKDICTNTLYVSSGEKNQELFGRDLQATNISWMTAPPKKFPYRCQARIRYRQPLQHCEVHRHRKDWKIIFTKLQRAITPGQYIVFYKGDELLGGGAIT